MTAVLLHLQIPEFLPLCPQNPFPQILLILLWQQFLLPVFLHLPEHPLPLPQWNLLIHPVRLLTYPLVLPLPSYDRRRYPGYLWKSSPGKSQHCSDLVHHLPESYL